MKTFNELFNSIVNEKITIDSDGNIIDMGPQNQGQMPQKQHMKFIHIDLYEQSGSIITEQDFNEYKRGCRSRKKKGLVVYSCEEYIVLAINC
jgi:hypothetical protein